MRTEELYRVNRGQLLELAGGLAPEQGETPVPALPGWTVRDAYCHLTGLCADVLDGRMEGAGSPAWTAAQVQDRAGQPLRDVCAEWRRRGPALDHWLEERGNEGTIFVGFDVWNHHQDVRSALGIPGERDTDQIEYLLDAALRAFDDRFRRADAPALRVVTARLDRQLGSGRPGAVLHTTDYELLRMLFGRRSYAQMTQAAWEGDSTGYVDHLHLFEPPVLDLTDCPAT